MSPTVERANKVLMERPSSIPLLSRAIFGSSLLVNLLLVAAVAVFAVKWPADSPCPSAPLPATSLLEADYASKFVEWKVQFNKTFANFSEEARAFEAFAHAEDKINAHNAKNLNYRLGHNEFSHLPAEEFFAHRAGHLPSTHANHTRHPDRRIHTSNMIPTSSYISKYSHSKEHQPRRAPLYFPTPPTPPLTAEGRLARAPTSIDFV